MQRRQGLIQNIGAARVREDRKFIVKKPDIATFEEEELADEGGIGLGDRRGDVSDAGRVVSEDAEYLVGQEKPGLSVAFEGEAARSLRRSAALRLAGAAPPLRTCR